MIKRLICIFLFVEIFAFIRVLEAQIVKVINNKGTISTIDTSRAITGAATYVASPEQYTLSTSSVVQSGTIVIFTPTSANTTTAPLLKAGTQTVGVVITKSGHQALVAGDIAVGVPVIIIFDGTNWVLQTSQGSSTGSGITTIGTPSTSYSAGASLSGNTLTMGLANATNPGMLSVTNQTISGQKTFNSSTTIFGQGEGGTPADVFIRGPQAGGSSASGANMYIQASNGTGGGSSGEIYFQTATTGSVSLPVLKSSLTQTFSNASPSLSFTFPTGTSNNMLIVAVSTPYNSATAVTYGSSTMQLLTTLSSGNNSILQLYYLVNPATGTANMLSATLGGAINSSITAMAWSNVNTSSPFGTISRVAAGWGSSPSLTLTTETGQVVMDLIACNLTPTAANGQTTITNNVPGYYYSTIGYKSVSTGSTTVGYTLSGDNGRDYVAFTVNSSSTTTGSNALATALAITKSGNTQLPTGKYLQFADGSSNIIGLTAPSSLTSYTLTLPSAQGASSTYLKNDGSGNLTWGTPSSSISANSPLSFSGSALSISEASSGTSGYLNSTDWTTFNNKLSGTFTGLASGDFLKYNGTNWVNAAVALPSSTASAYSIYGNNTGATAAPSFFSPTLASALFANQGTTSSVLHGNAGGNPAWGSVVLTADVSGTLPVANGGTGSSTQNWVDLTTAQSAIGGAKTWTALGTFSAGLTASGAAVSINDNSNFATNINTGTSTGAVNIASGTTGGNAITIGNTAGATSLTQKVGTGNYVLDGVAGSTYSIGSSTVGGTMTIGGTAQTGTITLGSSTGAQTVNIGTGTGVSTVNIANGLVGNTVSIANGANTAAQTINIGAGASAANNTINIGSGNNTGGVTAITIGTNTNFANTTAIEGGNGAGAITLTPQTTGTIVIGAPAGTGAITLGSSSAAQTVNVGTGAGVSTVNIGSTAANSIVKVKSPLLRSIGTVITTNANLTLSGANMAKGSVFQLTGSTARTFTLDTGTNLSAALPGVQVGDMISFVVSNASTRTITMAGDTGTTLANTMTVTTLQSRTFYAINTGTNVWVIY